MTLVSDILLISSALGAAFYCFVLSGRLRRLGQLDGGVGQAIATLAEQIGEMKRTMDEAGVETRRCAAQLDEKIAEASDLIARLEAAQRTARANDGPSVGADSRAEDDQVHRETTDVGAGSGASRAPVAQFKRRFGPNGVG